MDGLTAANALRQRGTFRPVFPSGARLGDSLSCNVAFRIAIVPALALNLAAGPTILGAQQAPTDVPSVTIRVNTNSEGTVFKTSLSKKTGYETTILHSFAGGSDGGQPEVGVTMDKACTALP